MKTKQSQRSDASRQRLYPIEFSLLYGRRFWWVVAFVVCVNSWASGQRSVANQVLTLRVLELNKIDLSGSSLTLTIDKVGPDQVTPVPAINTTTTLVWTTNGESKKITVARANPSTKFELRIIARGVNSRSGVAAPEVALSDNLTHDLIVGVSRSAGKCAIEYTANATPEQGIGRETHTIAFTITSS